MRIAHFVFFVILFFFDKLLRPVHSWCLRTIFAGTTSMQSVDFSPDGEYILTGQTSGRVMLWKTDTLQILKTYNFTHKLWQAVFSPNQSLIAVVGQDDYVDLIDASSLSLIKTINTNQNKVYDVDFYSSQLFITCGDDKKTKVWNATSGTLFAQISNQNTPYACQCGGNKNWIVSAGNNFVQSYDQQGSNNNFVQYYDFNQGPRTFYGICIRSNTNYSIQVSSSGQILESQLDSSNTDQYITGTSGALYACAYSPDTTYFAVAGSNKDVFLFNATSRANKLQATLFANSTSDFKSAQFSPDSNSLIVSNQNGSVYFYKRFCSGCPVGSFPDQTTCTLCSAKMVGCSICTNSSSCKSCMAGYYISSSSCKSCAVLQGCANCNSSSNCTLCLPNYYQTGLTCTRCLSTQYGCVQCTGPLQCLECDKNSYLSGGICIKCTTLTLCIYCNSSSYCLQCVPGYYENAGVCTSCQSAVNLHCLVCQSATNCSACVSGFRLNSSRLCEKCSSQCLFCNGTDHCFDCVEQMYVTSSYTCDFCVHPCVTCTSISYCLSCVQSYYLSSSGVCKNCIIPCFSCNSSVSCQSCIVGYYLDVGTHLCIICNQTYPNCRQCTVSACLACEVYFILTVGSCENCSQFMSNCQICNSTSFCEQCMKGYYPTGLTGNDSCSPCPNDCSSCISSTNCSSCLPGYYLLNYACVACSGNCLTCSSSSSSTCYSCKQGYYLSTASLGSCFNCSVISKCVACHNSTYCVGCAAGYFLSSPTTCTICTPPCVQCKTSATDCLACDLGYYFYTSAGLGKCTQCNYGCSQCSNSSSVCLNCIIGYYYNSTTFQCLSCATAMTGCNICSSSSACIVCSTGYYPVSGVCRSCSLNINRCLKCNVLGTTCSICDYGYCLSSSNNSCLSCSSFLSNCEHCRTSSICQTCIPGFYVSGSTCSVCSTGCLTCSSPTTCQHCKNDYILLSSKLCQLCEDAIQGCRICTSTTVCSDCLLNYYLNGPVCSLCRSSIEGCQSCTNASACTYCSIYYQLQANNTCVKCQNIYTNCQVCGNTTIACQQCQLGYYLSNINSCISCNPGSTQGCIKCLSNLTCQQCMSGFYYNTTNNSCLKCDNVYSNCIYCSSSVCLQCQSGYYLTSGACSKCTGQGCEICYQFNSSQCITCNTRYYKSGTQCLLCSSSMPQCLQCSIPTACIECSIGFYLTSSNNCNLCSNTFNGCSICSSSGCIDCQANFFLNQTDKKCQNCTDFIPGCAFCVSQTLCLSCQNGYYIVNQTCEFCATLPGCLYCLNDSYCTYCQQSYFMCSFNNSCCSCADYIPGCYACVDNSTCISCAGHYQAIGGVCVEIRPEVLKNSKKILLKSYFIDESNLKHILYAQDFLFVYIEQNWTAEAQIVLIDKKYIRTQLIIYRVEWSQAMDQLIFYTNNPITDKLSESMKNMPFTKQSRRLLADTSVNLDFNLKLMISEKAAQDVMPSLNQVGDLYMDYPYFDASFYQSYIRNQPYYYFIFGFIITLAIFVGYSIKSSCYPSLADKGVIVPHILAIKTGALGLYPTFAQYVNYCYGFMTADFPWVNQYLGNLYGKSGDLSPDPLRMYYVNLSLISTYFLALIAIIFIWLSISLMGYLFPKHIRKLQSLKTFTYNLFAFGAIISGCLSLQGIILNSIHSLSMNTVFYILGVIIYLGIFIEIFYSWFTSRQFVKQLLKIKDKQTQTISVGRHLEKLRIFVKATLLSLMHIAPLYILSIVVFTEIAVIILDYIIAKRDKVKPKLQIISHLLANTSLMLLVLVSDALIGIILVSILIVMILAIEIVRFFYEIEKYSQIAQESVNQYEKTNELKSKQIIKVTFQESSMALKQVQQKDRGMSIVPLMKSRDPSKRKKKDEQNVLFSINELNFDNH